MSKPYPASRFLRHVIEAAQVTDVPAITEGVRCNGMQFILNGLPDNDLFLWLTWLEGRTPLRTGACRDFPPYTECVGNSLEKLYRRLQPLTHQETPILDV